MRTTMAGWALVATVMFCSVDSVVAQQAAAPPCPATVAAEFAGWSKPASVAPGGVLPIGPVRRLALKLSNAKAADLSVSITTIRTATKARHAG